jgi:hypothetical protein
LISAFQRGFAPAWVCSPISAWWLGLLADLGVGVVVCADLGVSVVVEPWV